VVHRIRDATPGEAALIADVHYRARAESYPAFLPPPLVNTRPLQERERRWHSFLGDPGYGRDRYLLVLEAAGTAVGFGAGGPQRHGDPAFPGEIWSLYLLQSDQRQGHGSRIVAELARRMGSVGYPALIVWTQAANAVSRRFYEKLGGTYVRTRLSRYGTGSIDLVGYGWPRITALTGESGRGHSAAPGSRR